MPHFLCLPARTAFYVYPRELLPMFTRANREGGKSRYVISGFCLRNVTGAGKSLLFT